MATAARGRNDALAACLDELGWSPKVLARKLNRVFGTGTVAESAPYHWRDAGRVPRVPLPTMTAYVLSQELGRVLSMDHLWQGKAAESLAFVPSDASMEHPWTFRGLARILEDWVLGGLVDRRRFLAISGSGLLAVVSEYLNGTAGRGPFSARLVDDTSTDPLVAQVEQNLPLLQQLDDEHGGARHLPYVGAQFRSVGLLLHDGGLSDAATIRLIRALAEIGQLAGWMAFDSADHGLAQRYFVTALRAAHQVNDRALCAHILADMSFQAASRSHPADAIALGEAARRASEGGTASVRASVVSRLAYGYAAAGRSTDFERASALARELVEDRTGSEEEPRWMYFLTPNHLECQAGYSLISLGRAEVVRGDRARGRRFVRQGQDLLETGAYAVEKGDPSQRRALFEGAWLALGYSASGDLERSCEVGETAAARLSTVRSPRSTAVLNQLAAELRRRQRNAYVRDFLPDLEERIAEQRNPRSTRTATVGS
ncbi:carph-isopro domain-containing protein [Streptomyces fulvoviolaceus]|uniref:carph-isopro domain-containing protein n=1 Tax=Streptomyces fulvoviolaceus TaxID=285535 RepID=UPI0021BED2C6|nr:transcriptional regulator [Streptomyces fulvoviolaceus]MCT9080456.1 transcriptional regulator [Streptomyces fulvoviolaceus]